uniref:Uncharacterized protein n=1 Tax=Panagrolaimus superbus TaxID=310955 RepID=A0A914XVY6_9BILA
MLVVELEEDNQVELEEDSQVVQDLLEHLQQVYPGVAAGVTGATAAGGGCAGAGATGGASAAGVAGGADAAGAGGGADGVEDGLFDDGGGAAAAIFAKFAFFQNDQKVFDYC